MKAPKLLVLALIVTLLGVVPAAGGDDELPPSQDNGGAGRSSGDPTPVQSCNESVHQTDKSLIIRRLPAGPVRDDGSLAFTSGVCVYLPPGYATSGLRYPVLYLLHGGGGDANDWITQGDLRNTMDNHYAKDKRTATIVVTPDGTDGQWYDSYDRSLLNERYMFDHVIPYVDRHFRTIADRSGRIIDGLSNGGYGAMHFAAKRPDLFAAAGAMSANLGGRSFTGLGTPIAAGLQAQEAGTYYYGNVPIELTENLDGVDLVMDWGSSCASDLSQDLCARWGFEQAFRYDNQAFRDRLMSVSHVGALDYRETEGSHAWWWWTPWLRDRHLPFLWERLADPVRVVKKSQIRLPFRYRSIKPSFEVYGYDVAIDRDVSEFLSLDVAKQQLVVKGSGQVTITTAPIYRRNATYRVGSRSVRADRSGRLRIVVDLGPSHTVDEYSPEGRLAKQSGDYFTTKTVTIR